MSNRINGDTRTTNGDSGYTELISGKRLPKSHRICYIYNYLQKTINNITLWVLRYNSFDLLEKEDLRLLKELRNPGINDLGANLWCKLQNNKYIISDSLVAEFNQRRIVLNSQFKNAQEFVVFHTIPSCELYNLCIDIRNIEHFCWDIIHHYDTFNPEDYSVQSQKTGSAYNMLGDYMFNLCRSVEKKLCTAIKFSPEEEYWDNQDYATIIEAQLNQMG